MWDATAPIFRRDARCNPNSFCTILKAVTLLLFSQSNHLELGLF